MELSDYPVLDVECAGRLCVAIVARGHPHVLADGSKRIVVLPVGFTLEDLVHEMIHAAGVDREEDALKLEAFIMQWVGAGPVDSGRQAGAQEVRPGAQEERRCGSRYGA